MNTPPSAPQEPEALISLRAAVILLLAAATGACAGILTYLADQSLAASVLAGGTAAGGALLLFNGLIGRR